MVRSMTDHALACETCYNWVTSGDFGNNPTCPEGKDIREEIRTDHEKVWESLAS